MVDVLLRTQLAFFVRAAFAEVSPGVTLIWDEYLDLICARLGDVVKGKIRNLIITVPPRHLKSGAGEAQGSRERAAARDGRHHALLGAGVYGMGGAAGIGHSISRGQALAEIEIPRLIRVVYSPTCNW